MEDLDKNISKYANKKYEYKIYKPYEIYDEFVNKSYIAKDKNDLCIIREFKISQKNYMNEFNYSTVNFYLISSDIDGFIKVLYAEKVENEKATIYKIVSPYYNINGVEMTLKNLFFSEIDEREKYLSQLPAKLIKANKSLLSEFSLYQKNARWDKILVNCDNGECSTHYTNLQFTENSGTSPFTYQNILFCLGYFKNDVSFNYLDYYSINDFTKDFAIEEDLKILSDNLSDKCKKFLEITNIKELFNIYEVIEKEINIEKINENRNESDISAIYENYNKENIEKIIYEYKIDNEEIFKDKKLHIELIAKFAYYIHAIKNIKTLGSFGEYKKYFYSLFFYSPFSIQNYYFDYKLDKALSIFDDEKLNKNITPADENWGINGGDINVDEDLNAKKTIKYRYSIRRSPQIKVSKHKF